MKKMSNRGFDLEIVSGITPIRIRETSNPTVPERCVYGLAELEKDMRLASSGNDAITARKIRTEQEVPIVKEGDLVLSLQNPKAAIVSREHDGYLQTINTVVLKTSKEVDPKFLLFLINEEPKVQQLLLNDNLGSIVSRTTVRQVEKLGQIHLPDMKTQRLIGDVYLKQIQMAALTEKREQLQRTMMRGLLRRIENESF